MCPVVNNGATNFQSRGALLIFHGSIAICFMGWASRRRICSGDRLHIDIGASKCSNGTPSVLPPDSNNHQAHIVTRLISSPGSYRQRMTALSSQPSQLVAPDISRYHTPRRGLYLLILALGLATLLRTWGIDFGLPYEITYNQLSYEELKEVQRALKLGAGEYVWTFGKGGLYYLLFIEYAIFYVVSWVMGWVGNANEFALQILADRTTVVLLGRYTVALMGTLTCLIVYGLGKRVYDWRVGVSAAFLGAAGYYHAAFSSVINVDIGMTLALWASMLAYLRYEAEPQLRWLLLAGALGGMATAFKLPGIVALPLLGVAIVSAPQAWRSPRLIARQGLMVGLAFFMTLTIVAPEWTTMIEAVSKNYAGILGETSKQAADGQMRVTIDALTVRPSEVRTMGYVQHLVKAHNVVLALTALLGMGLGLVRRHRWDLIWGGFAIVFIAALSLSDRNQPERYLLPMMPALWMLSSRAITTLCRPSKVLMALGLAAVMALPSIALARHATERTYLDTRLLAKDWIEANVPLGAKLLMDGTLYRFIPSPPLTPNLDTVARQVNRATGEGERVGRGGMSPRALKLYRESIKRAPEPKYDLHSTVWGLAVQDLSYYRQHCFDYIVTSSYATKRFDREQHRQRFPKSARFYQQLPRDPRFVLVYRAAPEPWAHSGPTIAVYQVASMCQEP